MITMNDEEAVARTIDDIRSVVPEAEIVMVDSSQDRTAEIAQQKGAVVIKQLPARGHGPAMDLVLRSARGRVVVTTNCDGSYPAEMIPALARYIFDDGWDLVDGARVTPGHKPKAMTWLSFIRNIGLGLIASILFMRWLPDLHSGMRAYRRSLIQGLKYDPRGPALPVELLTLPIKNGARVKVLPISYHAQIAIRGTRSMESAWWTLKRLVRVRFS